jgi:hypothetical protein
MMTSHDSRPPEEVRADCQQPGTPKVTLTALKFANRLFDCHRWLWYCIRYRNKRPPTISHPRARFNPSWISRTGRSPRELRTTLRGVSACAGSIAQASLRANDGQSHEDASSG